MVDTIRLCPTVGDVSVDTCVTVTDGASVVDRVVLCVRLLCFHATHELVGEEEERAEGTNGGDSDSVAVSPVDAAACVVMIIDVP